MHEGRSSTFPIFHTATNIVDDVKDQNKAMSAIVDMLTIKLSNPF